MKNILIAVSLLVTATVKANNYNCLFDTLPTIQLIPYLEQMNVANYYNQPVDNFLNNVPANFYNMKVYGLSNSYGALFRASHLVVDFTADPSGPKAIIYVRTFNYLTRYSPTATWNVGLFRQEVIYKIDIYKDQNTCINGWCLVTRGG